MRLPDSDWLHKAKALAIGAKASIYHQGERTPALNIANLPDRWTAYCHRCKAKSVVMKTTVKLTLDAPKKSYAADPGPLWEVSVRTPNPNVPIANIVGFLHSKGMSIGMFQQPPMYAPQAGRLIFDTVDARMGRDITGRVAMKWQEYKRYNAYNRARALTFTGHQVFVLTEDYFSAVKAQFYCPSTEVLCVSLMGTRLSNDLLCQLMEAKPRKVVLLLDNDKGGWDGEPTIARGLRSVGLPVETRWPPSKDPKNQSAQWWAALYEDIL
jgi:hypothetical protein